MANDLTAALHLNEREAAFVALLVANPANEPAYIKALMVEAGYSQSYAHVEHNALMRKPHILAAIYVETARRLRAAAPRALQTVEAIESGEIDGPGAKVRLDAAKDILARSGFVAPRAPIAGSGSEKTLAEMSLDELKRTQDRLQAELAARAKPVNAQVTPAPSDDVIDLLD